MKKLLALSTLLLALACADEAGSRKALHGLGLTNVQFTGVSWFGCSKDEIGTNFKATNPRGDAVSGQVCCGALLSFKACTVRF